MWRDFYNCMFKKAKHTSFQMVVLIKKVCKAKDTEPILVLKLYLKLLR